MLTDNHVVPNFDTRKIYKLSNEVIFFAPFFVFLPFCFQTWRYGNVMLTQLVYILDRKQKADRVLNFVLVRSAFCGGVDLRIPLFWVSLLILR